MIKLYELWPKRRLFWDKLRVHTLFCIFSKSKEYIDIFSIVQNSTIPSYLTNYVKHLKFSCYLSLNARFSEKNNLFFSNFHTKQVLLTQKQTISLIKYIACWMILKGHLKNSVNDHSQYNH